LGGVDAAEFNHRHSSINAPALWAPPLILEGVLLSRWISTKNFIEFAFFIVKVRKRLAQNDVLSNPLFSESLCGMIICLQVR
jgi:hypothetical protein